MQLVLCTGTARADVIISAPSIVAQAGSSGSFEVLIKSSPPSIPEIEAFSFDILMASPFVEFTGASTNTTAKYIFGNDSFVAINGFPFTTKTGQELIASDLTSAQSVAIFPGDTFLLGTVFYSLSSSAPSGSVPIMFRVPGTSVGKLGGSVATTTVDGEISIVPEPDQVAIILGSLAVIGFLSRRAGGDPGLARSVCGR